MHDADRKHHGLTEILLDAGVVTPDQVEAGLIRQRETGLRIGETLVEIGAATEEDIGWALSRQLGLPLVDLQADTLDSDLLNRFPAGLLYRLEAVPLLHSEDGLSVALSDPTDRQVTAHLEAMADCPVLPSVSTPTAIRRVLAPRLGAQGGAKPSGTAHPVALVWDRSGANFLHFHVHAARRAGATAVHFVPDATGVTVFQRRAAGVVRVASESAEAFEGLLTQLELLGAPIGRLEDDAQREAVVECSIGPESVRLGVVMLAHAGATTLTLRVPSTSAAPTTLEGLGLAPLDVARVRGVLDEPAGLVLVCGPAGSGCTTTLSCLLAEAVREDRSAIVFGSMPVARPAGGLVLALPSREAGHAWESIVVAHAPDIVVLDDLLFGAGVAAVGSGAGMGRLVLASTDWGDTFAMLAYAASLPHLRSTLAGRLRLVLQQRRLPAAGAGERVCFEVLFVSDPLRDAIQAGAAAHELRGLAVAERFRSLDAWLEDAVRAGTVESAAAARARAV